MGSATSTRRPSAEQQEQESLAASTGFLPFLKSVFAKLSFPQSQSITVSSLHQCLSLPPLTINLPPVSSHPLPNFPFFFSHLGPAVADLLFITRDDSTDWIAFLRGFNSCCALMPASESLLLLYRLFSDMCRRSGISCRLTFVWDDADGWRVRGLFEQNDLKMFLWLCWAMGHCLRLSTSSGGGELVLPDLSHLMLAVFMACGEVGGGDDVWNLNGLGSGKIVAVEKLSGWILGTVPGLTSCFSKFLREKIRSAAVSEEEDSNKSNPLKSSCSQTNSNDSYLLTFGRAWAISLTQRNTLGEELLAASFPGLFSCKLSHLLYRLSTHGMGLSRFWATVEGYHGPLMFLFSGTSPNSGDDDKYSTQKWVIAVLTEHGFKNSDMFYGSSACIYAISPIFRVFYPTHKETNFLYSHLRPTGRFYEANSKPAGLAFGGTLGNERIFIDEEFTTVVLRHHAVDKTYQHGSLIPNQGYLPVQASLVDAEVWGFGGSSAKEKQDTFKNREALFTEQRRRVDLKTFTNWEDSPEKLMMGMISDPNRNQREER